MSVSTPSINGSATLKIVWNTATTTRQNTKGPTNGCRNTPSSLRVHCEGAGAR